MCRTYRTYGTKDTIRRRRCQDRRGASENHRHRRKKRVKAFLDVPVSGYPRAHLVGVPARSTFGGVVAPGSFVCVWPLSIIMLLIQSICRRREQTLFPQRRQVSLKKCEAPGRKPERDFVHHFGNSYMLLQIELRIVYLIFWPRMQLSEFPH